MWVSHCVRIGSLSLHLERKVPRIDWRGDTVMQRWWHSSGQIVWTLRAGPGPAGHCLAGGAPRDPGLLAHHAGLGLGGARGARPGRARGPRAGRPGVRGLGVRAGAGGRPRAGGGAAVTSMINAHFTLRWTWSWKVKRRILFAKQIYTSTLRNLLICMSCFFPSGDGRDIGTHSLLRAILLTQLTRDLSYIKLEIIISYKLDKNQHEI